MGLDTYAKLFYGVKFDNVFEKTENVQEYDLHDPKTGLKTGKKGFDVEKSLTNKFTGKVFKNDPYSVMPEINGNTVHCMRQEYGDYIFGIEIISVCYQDSYKGVRNDLIERWKEEFEQKFRKHIGDLKPELYINLYHSY